MPSRSQPPTPRATLQPPTPATPATAPITAAATNGRARVALTPREREVAALVAQGLTNRQIASSLVISERTAEYHVEQIMNKLGVHSRAQIAAWTVERGLVDTAGPESITAEPEATTAEPEAIAAEPEASPALGEVVTPAIRPAHRRWLIATAIVTAVALVALGSFGVVVALWRSGPSVPIRTVAGTGVRAAADDARSATMAALTLPLGMTVDAAGVVYFIDGNRVRQLTASGGLATIAGTHDPGYAGDGGPAFAARLNAPQGLAIDGEGSLYIADTLNHRVRKVDANGTMWTVAGTGNPGYAGDGGPALLATLNMPVGVALGFGRSLYITDSANNRVRRISADGSIATVAGTGDLGYAGDGGPATAAPVGAPTGIAFDSKGNLYIADTFNDRIRKVDLAGTITTVAGTGVRGFSGDGTRASQARLDLAPGPPRSAGQVLAVDTEGNLYIADAANNRVRRVSVSGGITTLAGTGQAGYAGDGGPASAAQLNEPLGLAVDADGALYIADTENNRIRKAG